MKKTLSHWSRRNLTPYGKLIVIKNLVMSKMVHLWLTIPNPSKNFIKEVNSLLFNFLWSGTKDKIKRDICIKHYNDGGLNMIHLEHFINASKISWIKRRLYSNESKWCHLYEFFCQPVEKHQARSCLKAKRPGPTH